MSGRNDIGAGLVNCRVDAKRRTIDRLRTVYDVTFVVDENQIADSHVAKAFCKWVDPEVIRELRVAHGDVTGNAFAETEATENAHCTGKFFFAMLTLLFECRKFWWRELRHSFWRQLDAVDRLFGGLVLDDCHDFRLRQGEQGCVDELLWKQVKSAVKFCNRA